MSFKMSDLFWGHFFLFFFILSIWCHSILAIAAFRFAFLLLPCLAVSELAAAAVVASVILTNTLSRGVPSVPSGPPRKIEVEALNATCVKVIWRSPDPSKQHGQIRGYQVHYVRMLNEEPVGQSVIKDILIDDMQVAAILFLSESPCSDL